MFVILGGADGALASLCPRMLKYRISLSHGEDGDGKGSPKKKSHGFAFRAIEVKRTSMAICLSLVVEIGYPEKRRQQRLVYAQTSRMEGVRQQLRAGRDRMSYSGGLLRRSHGDDVGS